MFRVGTGWLDGDTLKKRFQPLFAWRTSCLTDWYQSETSGVGSVVGGWMALTWRIAARIHLMILL